MRPADGVITVDTQYARPQQDASHLIVEQGRAAFVDTGVNDSVPLLLAALENENIAVADVEYVFLTHVHLDHAGGAGLLMQQLPSARCIVHPRGAPHMIDPTKIMAGTEAVYGKAAARQLYGQIVPIEASRIDIVADGEWFRLAGRALQAFYTEGHARHHYCLYDPIERRIYRRQLRRFLPRTGYRGRPVYLSNDNPGSVRPRRGTQVRRPDSCV